MRGYGFAVLLFFQTFFFLGQNPEPAFPRVPDPHNLVLARAKNGVPSLWSLPSTASAWDELDSFQNLFPPWKFRSGRD